MVVPPLRLAPGQPPVTIRPAVMADAVCGSIHRDCDPQLRRLLGPMRRLR